jgi:HD-GYP domain-containing protein (c-di-GMP phosphodiesterase class II)
MTLGSLQSRGFLPVATATLDPATVLGCDLYIQRNGVRTAELYRERNYPFEPDDLARLREAGVDHLYVRLEEADAYRAYLCTHVLHQAEIPITVRLNALREVTRIAFQDALTANNCDRLVHAADDFSRDLAQMVAEHSPAFGELFAMLEHDYYTFTHVCNVSIYCAVIGFRMGFCELARLAAGALLHDIGKRHIPHHILNKPGDLTDEEWALVYEHPTVGFRELAGRTDLTWGQLMMVYQHHERLDGSGYPTGVRADEIHPWAKICSVADVFDAMTCQRSYRRGMPLSLVCDFLRKNAGTRFDSEVVTCWLAQMRSRP